MYLQISHNNEFVPVWVLKIWWINRNFKMFPKIEQTPLRAMINVTLGQTNLIKTFQNQAKPPLITKIALIFFYKKSLGKSLFIAQSQAKGDYLIRWHLWMECWRRSCLCDYLRETASSLSGQVLSSSTLRNRVSWLALNSETMRSGIWLSFNNIR